MPVIMLCGGRSRRMGTDKIRLPLVGKTVYHRVEDTFAPWASHLVVVIGHAAQPPESDRDPIVVADEHADLGPLEGLRVGLRVCQQLGAELAMVTTGDAPLVVPQLYRFMIDLLVKNPDHDGVVPYVDDTWHPLTAVYRTRILEQVQQRVQRRQLRVKELMDSIAVLKLTRDRLEPVDPGLQSLRNINTREQYLQLRQELERPGEPDPS